MEVPCVRGIYFLSTTPQSLLIILIFGVEGKPPKENGNKWASDQAKPWKIRVHELHIERL